MADDPDQQIVALSLVDYYHDYIMDSDNVGWLKAWCYAAASCAPPPPCAETYSTIEEAKLLYQFMTAANLKSVPKP